MPKLIYCKRNYLRIQMKNKFIFPKKADQIAYEADFCC